MESVVLGKNTCLCSKRSDPLGFESGMLCKKNNYLGYGTRVRWTGFVCCGDLNITSCEIITDALSALHERTDNFLYQCEANRQLGISLYIQNKMHISTMDLIELPKKKVVVPHCNQALTVKMAETLCGC